MNPIYKTFSGLLLIKFMLVQAIIAGIILVLGFHYYENPEVFFYFIIILLAFMLYINLEVIEIYSDKLVFKKVYAFGFFPIKKTFDYYFVKKIGFVGDFDADNDLAEDLIDILIPGPNHTRDYLNSIEVEMTDGTTKSFETRIYKKEIKVAFKKMLDESNYRETINRNAKLRGDINKV